MSKINVSSQPTSQSQNHVCDSIVLQNSPPFLINFEAVDADDDDYNADDDDDDNDQSHGYFPESTKFTNSTSRSFIL